MNGLEYNPDVDMAMTTNHILNGTKIINNGTSISKGEWMISYGSGDNSGRVMRLSRFEVLQLFKMKHSEVGCF